MIATGTLKRVMKAFDWQLQKKGYIPMSGQIFDASLAPAPKQRKTEGEQQAIKSGKSARDIWPDEKNKECQCRTDFPQKRRSKIPQFGRSGREAGGWILGDRPLGRAGAGGTMLALERLCSGRSSAC